MSDLQSLNFGVHTLGGRQEIGTFGITPSVRQRSTEEFANKEERRWGLEQWHIGLPHSIKATDV